MPTAIRIAEAFRQNNSPGYAPGRARLARAAALQCLRRLYRRGLCLLLASALAACSTAPLRTGGGTPQPFARTESAPHTLPPGLPQFIDHSVGEEEISIEAMSLVGVPYRWGGNTPDSGFDCSGLVDYVVRRAASVNLPRTTEQMESYGSSIEPDEISPGDLIFFNTTGRAHSHVGIYVGQYRFVNAPSTGGTVRIDYVTNPYWAKRFDGIRRVAAARPGQPFENAPLEAAAPAHDSGPATAPVAAVEMPTYNGSRSIAMPLNAATGDAVRQVTAPADANPDADPDAPDPIARIANLAGAGAGDGLHTHEPPTAAALSAGTAQAAPPHDPTPAAAAAADPIAGFANSNL